MVRLIPEALSSLSKSPAVTITFSRHVELQAVLTHLSSGRNRPPSPASFSSAGIPTGPSRLRVLSVGPSMSDSWGPSGGASVMASSSSTGKKPDSLGRSSPSAKVGSGTSLPWGRQRGAARVSLAPRGSALLLRPQGRQQGQGWRGQHGLQCREAQTLKLRV